MFNRYIIITLLFLGLASCKPRNKEQKEKQMSSLIQDDSRIVSLNGTLTEILCAFGLENNIVGTDVTSTYPPSMQQMPKVGHNRNISSEGIISLNPNLVVGIEGEVNPVVRQQIKAAGIQTLWLSHQYMIKDRERLIREIANTLAVSEKVDSIIKQIHEPLQQLASFEEAPKVLFIYARGAGTLLASGKKYIS